MQVNVEPDVQPEKFLTHKIPVLSIHFVKNTFIKFELHNTAEFEPAFLLLVFQNTMNKFY